MKQEALLHLADAFTTGEAGQLMRRLQHSGLQALIDAQAAPRKREDVFVDATYCKVRVGGRVVSQAVVIATGATAAGRRPPGSVERQRR